MRRPVWKGIGSPFGSPSRRDAHLREFVRLAFTVLGADTLTRPMLRVPPRHDGKGLPERMWLRTVAGRARRVDYAKQIARRVAKQFGVPLPKLALRFATLEGRAGQVQHRHGVWNIEIDESYRWDDAGLTAILAHEFAHVVLASKGVRLESTLSNEYLTDAVAALAGFAPILHKVSERQETQYLVFSTRTITHRLGYLSRRDFAALEAIHRRLAKDVPKRRLLELTVRVDTLLECVCCGSSLRLPPVDGRLRVRCPICGLREDVTIRHGYVSASAPTRAGRMRDRVLASIDRFNGFTAPD